MRYHHYMIFIYSQKTLCFIEDIMFFEVLCVWEKQNSFVVAAAHLWPAPAIIDTAFIKASFPQMIKLGLVPHPALTRRPGDPPFLLHRIQGEVQI